MKDKTSVFVGQSGVGKSALINAIEPGLDVVTMEVSEKTGKGRHTTTHTELHHLSFGGFIADTPGVKELYLFFQLQYQNWQVYFSKAQHSN